jgi:hypothetical protein
MLALETDCLHLFVVFLKQRLDHSSSGPGNVNWKLLMAIHAIWLLLSNPSVHSGNPNKRHFYHCSKEFPFGGSVSQQKCWWSIIWSFLESRKCSPDEDQIIPKEVQRDLLCRCLQLGWHQGTCVCSKVTAWYWMQTGGLAQDKLLVRGLFHEKVASVSLIGALTV